HWVQNARRKKNSPNFDSSSTSMRRKANDEYAVDLSGTPATHGRRDSSFLLAGSAGGDVGGGRPAAFGSPDGGVALRRFRSGAADDADCACVYLRLLCANGRSIASFIAICRRKFCHSRLNEFRGRINHCLDAMDRLRLVSRRRILFAAARIRL